MLKKCSWILTFNLILSFIACTPVPRRTLTTEEKKADLYWLYSIFSENYAPLKYKEENLNLDFEELKTSTLDAALVTRDNESFYRVMHKFSASFKDAHTSSSLTMSQNRGRSKVAYLGFDGERHKDGILVTSFLPASQPISSNFPIQVGDVITHFDGVKAETAIKNTYGKRYDLGNHESNLTAFSSYMLLRLSLDVSMPEKKSITLTLKPTTEGEAARQVTLLWIVKDTIDFIAEQREAYQRNSSSYANHHPTDKKIMETLLNLAEGNYELLPKKVQSMVQNQLKYQPWRKFYRADYRNLTKSTFLRSLVEEHDPSMSPELYLSWDRKVPNHVHFVPNSIYFPTYIARVNDQGQPDIHGTKLVAYLRLYSFNVWSDAIEELAETLKYLKFYGIDSLVIDTIDNGGGSLYRGMQIAQLFSHQKIIAPSIAIGTSDSWLDEFEYLVENGDSDIERNIHQQIFEQILNSKQDGRKISDPVNVHSLYPYQILPTKHSQEFKIALLVNEMCASMCDIFAATMQDNKLATIIGSQTMGAGGNIQEYYSAPNSGLSVSQTESLIIRSNGEYIENNGIVPDIEVPVYQFAYNQYSEVIHKAFNMISKAPDQKNSTFQERRRTDLKFR